MVVHSSLATDTLKQRQRKMGLPQKKLKQDIATRWNSTFYMVHQMRWPVVAVLSDDYVTKRSDRHLDLRPDQWQVVRSIRAT